MNKSMDNGYDISFGDFISIEVSAYEVDIWVLQYANDIFVAFISSSQINHIRTVDLLDAYSFGGVHSSLLHYCCTFMATYLSLFICSSPATAIHRPSDTFLGVTSTSS